ncbi:MAG: MFS transporter, partial [Rhodospirillaceae bacterium]
MVDLRPPKFIFPALVTVTLIAPLAVHMFIPALPVVKAELDVSDSMAFSTISLVMIVMAFATVVYGGFSDQWGRKPVLLTGLALYTIGAELSWFAT